MTLAGFAVYATQQQFTPHLVGLALLTYGLMRLLTPFVLTPLLMPQRARRLYRETKSLQEPTEIGWDETAISFKANSWHADSSWSEFTRWREGTDHFILYLNSFNSFRIVPKRSFPDEASRTDFAHLLKKNIKLSH